MPVSEYDLYFFPNITFCVSVPLVLTPYDTLTSNVSANLTNASPSAGLEMTILDYPELPIRQIAVSNEFVIL
jgi:hypothetical protein